MLILRSLVFTLFMAVTALIWATLITLAWPLVSRARRFAMVRAWARLIMAAARRICGLHYVVEGRDNMPDEPAVVYLKHSSAWETISEIAECPPHTWVLKRELVWIPLVGTAVLSLWCIAINRKAGMSAVEQVVEQGIIRLRGGFNVMIFPEGTRMASGETRRYGRSGAILATRAGCSIVPIAHNACEFWPRRSLVKYPGTIRFCIGPPITTDGKSAAQVNAEAKDWIDSKMAEISPAYSYPVPEDNKAEGAASAGTG